MNHRRRNRSRRALPAELLVVLWRHQGFSGRVPRAVPLQLGGSDVCERGAMLGVSWDTIRLFLHVLAATVWVGGQLTLAALVPVLRVQGPAAPKAAARRFNLVAWPAYGVL